MPASAVKDEGALAIREPGVALRVLEVGSHLEKPARIEARAGDVAARVLVGLAHVDEGEPLVSLDPEQAQRLLG